MEHRNLRRKKDAAIVAEYLKFLHRLLKAVPPIDTSQSVKVVSLAKAVLIRSLGPQTDSISTIDGVEVMTGHKISLIHGQEEVFTHLITLLETVES